MLYCYSPHNAREVGLLSTMDVERLTAGDRFASLSPEGSFKMDVHEFYMQELILGSFFVCVCVCAGNHNEIDE